MQVLVLKENLSKALGIVGRSISTKNQLPILSHVLLETEEGKLKISATNLEMGIVMTIGSKVQKEGKVALPGKFFFEFISSLQSEKIELVLEKNQLFVKAKKTQSSFSTVNVSDFPPFPTIPEKKKTFVLEKIKDPIDRTVFAASSDESRLVLTGVRVHIKEGVLSLAATDGYRMSLEKVPISKNEEDFAAILPAQSLLEVSKIATEIGEKEMGLSVIEGKNQVVFLLPNISVFSRLIDGEFPSIEKIIPTEFKTRVTIDKESFCQSVKTASLFARASSNIVKIQTEKEGVRMRANSPQVGENEDFVEAKTEGEPVEVAFNYRFLTDLLSHFPTSDVVMETTGPLNPCLFKTVSSSSFLHVIMPVRVQG